MGIDGENTLTLRGPKEVLDLLEANGCGIANTISPYMLEFYFGPKNVKILRRTPNQLVIGYPFRNDVFREYLLLLLKTYPQIWMKNEHYDENGGAGVWIANMSEGIPHVQECTWQELSLEEMSYLTDFSKSLAESAP